MPAKYLPDWPPTTFQTASESHNAADNQTGSIGDVEIVLTTDDRILTGYEMKLKRVTTNDIDIALPKILDRSIDNYIFITTEIVSAR